MSLLLTEEQKDLISMIKEFGQNEILPVAAEYDRNGEMPIELYKKAFDMGLHMIDIPEEYGGGGLDAVTAVILQEELSKFDAGFGVGVFSSGLAVKPVLIAGTDEQKKYFADAICEGKFSAFALTEPDAGSDVAATKTKAEKDGDKYIINGRKCFITSGGIADIYVVFASTDRTKGVKGLTAFIVDRNTSGISVGKEEDKMGIRLSNTADVVFEDVRVPAKNMLGKEGDGFKIAMMTLDMSRPSCAAAAVGLSQAALDYSVEYAKQRKTFGKPIAMKQAIQFKLAEMKMQIETARIYTRHAASMIDAKVPYSSEAAIAKCYAGDVAVKVTQEAVQIFGGYGYSREYPVEKLYRDAKIFQIFEGTNEVQKIVIAGNLLR
ncbi:MAG: acyl-CoA dehydrogenase family protein [Anaerostipes sp.]|nr:acyl-CoA dehydrogenase family protein [Anaerostipes sp.]MDD3745383.1 acyl-CoA dehydrogenase family protein [Anaerostipes sp.]